MKKTVKKIIMAVSCGGFSVAAQESADFLSGDFVTNNRFDMIFTVGWGTNPYVW